MYSLYPKLKFAFLLFLSSFMSFKSVGTKKWQRLKVFYHFRQLVKDKGIAERVKTAISFLKPGLHIGITIAEHICDHVPKRKRR